MARQRKRYGRTAPTFPLDFPRHLERFKKASGLSWGEMAERLGTTPLRLRRWRRGVRPRAEYVIALLELAASMELIHLLLGTEESPRDR